MTGFAQRMKRRKLVQWTVAYLAAAWVALQVLDLVMDSYGWPRAVIHIAFGVLAVGFVMVLVLAWYHGERGMQRASGMELLLLALVLAAGGGLLWTFSRTPSKSVAAKTGVATREAGYASAPATRAAANPAPAQTAAFNPPANSILVLPFANLSSDKHQRYFSDGITEELTGALGQNTGLTVIAWETAAHYRDSANTPAAIGRALNVANILDGSIQRAGDKVRVSAELVSTVTGRQQWFAHYDDSLKDIFAVQDRISQAIAKALKVKFAGMQTAPTLNPQAHELYLKGLAALDRYTAKDAQSAVAYFRQALQHDPNYADAWAGMASAYGELTEVSTLPLAEAVSKMRAAAQKALSLDPRNVNAHIELGSADVFDKRSVLAAWEFQQAIKLDPSNALAHLAYGNVLPPKRALAEEREAGRLDPANAIVPLNLAVEYQRLGDWPHMLAAAQTILPRSPHNIAAALLLAYAYTQLHRGEDAVQAFALVQTSTAAHERLMDTGRLAYQARLKPALRGKALAALDALRRADISPTAQSGLVQLYLALNEKHAALELLGHFCAAAPYGCNDLAINPMYAALHGNPRFAKLAKRYTTITRTAATASAASR